MTSVVLIVDDEEPIRLGLRDLMEGLGLTVELAENGKEAVQLLTRAAPNYYGVVLLDVVMPVMDGFAVYEQLRSIFPALPVIVMSGHDDRDVAHRLSADDDPDLVIVQKPFEPDNLTSSVQHLLGM